MINGIAITDASQNQIPVAVNDNYDVTEDTTLIISAPGVLTNDYDPDAEPLTATLVDDVDHGVLILNANGSFTYTPDTGYTGADSFTYEASDGQVNSNTATVLLNINDSNQAPVLNAIGSRSSNEGESLTFTISATDPDVDPLTYSVSNQPDGASFDPGTQTFSWSPRYDQAGVYSVRFEVSDSQLTDYEDVSITIIQLYEDWDVNGDSNVNILDMIQVGQHWSENGLTGWIIEDVNEDGTIGILDMIIISQYWTG